MSIGLTILIIWVVRIIFKFSTKNRDCTFLESIIAIILIIVEIILVCKTWNMNW